MTADLGLIAFSSTPGAAEASEYAFSFYRTLLGLQGADTGLHTLAQKGVHFALFSALGAALYSSLRLGRPWRIGMAIGICFLAGMGSEAIQILFPQRHASLWDVLLNGSSGSLAVGVLVALEPARGDTKDAKEAGEAKETKEMRRKGKQTEWPKLLV